MNALTVLRKARELYAANPSHASIGEELPDGTVCALTATTEAASLARIDAELAADRLFREVVADDLREFEGVVGWNARSSTAEVLAAFDRAIELAETQA